MAVWEVRTVKQVGDRFWENVWHLDIGDDTDVAPAVIDAFRDFDRSLLRDIFTLARIVRRPAGSTDEFVEVVLDLAGLLPSTGIVLPLFNTVRVLLGVAAGRPGIKYLRGYLSDADLADDAGHIATGSISQVQTALDALFNSVSDAGYFFVVGEADKASVSPTVDALVADRQRHRKRKKSS